MDVDMPSFVSGRNSYAFDGDALMYLYFVGAKPLDKYYDGAKEADEQSKVDIANSERVSCYHGHGGRNYAAGRLAILPFKVASSLSVQLRAACHLTMMSRMNRS